MGIQHWPKLPRSCHNTGYVRILAICTGKKVGGFLSDISGAFDRVNMLYMLGKLHCAGVGPQFLKFLSSYLAPRRGQVIVQGARSELFEIANSVFQGTVLGPCLWNTFFADVSVSAKSTGGKEAMFADDLSVFSRIRSSGAAAYCGVYP